jgi:sn-glycerol 3-phosphate transport system permease protein
MTPFDVLLVVVAFGLALFNLWTIADVIAQPAASFKEVRQNKWLWLAVVVLLGAVGSVLYLAIARKRLGSRPIAGWWVVAIAAAASVAALLVSKGWLLEGVVIALALFWFWGVLDVLVQRTAVMAEGGQQKLLWAGVVLLPLPFLVFAYLFGSGIVALLGVAVVGPLAALAWLLTARRRIDVRPGGARYLVLLSLSVIVLFPVYMTIVRAVSVPVAYINAGLPFHPVDFQPGAFIDAWNNGDLGPHMALSAGVTLIITSAQLITSVLAAYAFAFLRFPLKRLFFVLVMATLMLPIEVTLIPNVATMRELELFNSIPGLVLPFLATAFGIFLIRQGFMGIPEDLRDAAKLDGYGHLAFLTKIAIPVTRPIIASFTVISLLAAWNQYLWPRSIVTEANKETIQIALRSLLTSSPEQANIGVAGAIVAALPILIILIALQKQVIRGLTAGAVKG